MELFLVPRHSHRTKGLIRYNRLTLVTGDDGETKKRKRGPRKPKDPNAPKRPPSAYLIFQNEVRRGIKEKNPEMTNNEVLAEVAKLWGELTVEEKKVSSVVPGWSLI
jgi:hypothetical protein